MTYCDISFEELSAYHDGELQAEARQSMDHHIAGCPRCQHALADLGFVGSVVADSLRKNAEPPQLQERILEGVIELHQDAQARRAVTLYACCLMVVLAFVAWVVLSPLGRIVRVVFRLLFTAADSVFRMITATGFLWPTVIVLSCLIVGSASVAAVVRMLKSSEVPV